MSEEPEFDVVIVGGGPAGCSAAYFLAKKGYQILLLEKGRSLGSKNVYGGKIYSYYFNKLFPEFEKEAPVHRWVKKELYSITHGGDTLTFEYYSPEATSFTANLTEFVSWMGKKAEEAGATVLTETKVTDIIKKDGRVQGVLVGGEKVTADLTIIAEGANRILSESAGLVKNTSPHTVAVGIKETIKLDEKTINERFGLNNNEGASWLVLGDVTDGIPDGGFLYTFKDYVSVGAVITLGSALDKIDKEVYNFGEKIRLHNVIGKKLLGGEIIEYSAHLTIVDPLGFMPESHSGKGYMIIGDAGGILANMGYTFRGVDFAAYSGYLATQAYEKIRDGEDEKIFDKMLRETAIFEEIKRYSEVHKLLKNPRMLDEYPRLLDSLLKTKLHIRENTPLTIEAILGLILKEKINPLILLKDMFTMVKSI